MSGTILSSGAKVYGPTRRLLLQRGSKRSPNHYGLDVLRRKYHAFTDEHLAYEPVWLQPDFQFPSLVADDWEWTFDDNDAWLDITFKGLLNDALVTRAQTDSSGPLTSVQITTTTGQTVEVSYRAATTTYSYAVRNQPKGPLYSHTLFGGVGHIPHNIRPANHTGTIVGQFTRRTMLNDFHVKQAGFFWQVDETWALRLVDNGVSGGVGSGFSSGFVSADDNYDFTFEVPVLPP